MAKGSRHKTTGRQKHSRRAGLRLRVERLEPRMVLSSLGLAVPGAPIGPPLRDVLSAMFDASSASRFGPVKTSPVLAVDAKQGDGQRARGEPVLETIPLRAVAQTLARPVETAEGGMIDLGYVRSTPLGRPADGASATLSLSAVRLWGRMGVAVRASQSTFAIGQIRTGVLLTGEDSTGAEDRPAAVSVEFAGMTPPPEGGRLELDVSSPGRRLRPVGESHPRAEPLMSWPASGAPSAVHDFALLDPIRPGAPVAADPTSGAVASIADVPPPSKATAVSNVAPAALPAHESGLTGDRTRAWVASARDTSASTAEGGLIELDVAPRLSPSLSGQAEETPESVGRWGSPDAGESLENESGRGAEPRRETRIATDGDPRAGARSDADNAREDASRAPDSAEGGMIELAALVASAGSPRAAESLPEAANGEPFIDVRDVRMDNGVALFHAFELATAIPQHGEGNEAAFLETNGVGAPSDAVVPASAAVSPAAGEAAANGEESRGDSVSQVGTVRTVLVASFIASVGVRRGLTLTERRRSRSAGGQESKPEKAG